MEGSSRIWRRARLALPAAGAAVVLVVGATPAWAVSGSGSYAGYTYQSNAKQNPGCFETTGMLPESGTTATGTGTFGAYNGSISVSFNYDFYQNSAGSTTYGDTTCSTAGSGKVTNASVTGGSGANTVSCSWSSGTFTRSGTALTVVFPSSAGGCSVDGGTNSPTTMTSSGTFSNCLFHSTNQPPYSCYESYTYTAS